ncbi:hypothetical protein VCR15J2_390137 [Vibrio coralliirubri]|uniref:7-cyano-7-deazaguanine synthase n=1 Tax=Vibrio coralliirubri TaxID=1516159 RepID=UPI000634637A|nr:7-cyano-7-deazaguanine synthase [Vibrio coralliirubri]CDT54156.1 hypothetical protein VCR15J2_390137 [Vibrio coralliirubri]
MKIVVLVSGGMDSTILTHFTKVNYPEAEVVLLHYDYGHPFEFKERQSLPKGTVIRKFEWLNPNEPYLVSESDEAHLPGRDFAMIAQAMIQENPDRIFLGLLYGEMNSYLDQSYEFYYRLNHLLSIVSPTGKRVEVEAPLEAIGFDKLKAAKWAIDNGMTVEELKDSSSCMHHEHKKCGKCHVCIKRWAVFSAIGLKDFDETNPMNCYEIVEQLSMDYSAIRFEGTERAQNDVVCRGVESYFGCDEPERVLELLKERANDLSLEGLVDV